ncbi:MAG TPA: malate dehydrogenase [Thermoplasmata archaeon]|nr:malate dehydrogenase [Thermoplasmata archaeon]
MKAAVVGVGKLGGAIAFALARDPRWRSVVLTDAVEGLAEAQAEDIRHGLDARARADVAAGGLADLDGADLVVVCAGRGRIPGGTRLDLLGTNAPIVADVARGIGRVAPKAAVVVLTNPLDVMTALAQETSGLPRTQVLGSGGILDSNRLRLLLARRHGVRPSEVHAIVLGEHGERAVPVLSRARVRGEPLRVTKAAAEELLEALRVSSLRVIEAKGGTVFGPAGATMVLLEALFGSTPSVVPASVVLDGEYGMRGVSVGVPARVARGRVLRVDAWDLSGAELEALRRSGRDLAKFLEDARILLQAHAG